MRAYYAARAPSMTYADLSPAQEEMLAAYVHLLHERLRGRDVLEVACGTGYWTEKIAQAANRVMATDVVEAMAALATERSYPRGNVEVILSDAYSLEGVPGGWSGGFHFQWWSHVPRSRREDFLASFHAKLAPRATVVFGDNLDRGADPDEEGNLYQDRTSPDGGDYRIIKNCPSESELRALLGPFASSIEYHRFERDWFVTYVLPAG